MPLNNRITISKEKINEIMDIIRNKDKKHFIFIPRDIDTNKNPREYMVELEIDYNDAINYIKNLTIDDFIECILDKEKNYVYLYVFKKDIKGNLTYIKIGFLYDIKSGNVYVVSFHKDMNLIKE